MGKVTTIPIFVCQSQRTIEPLEERQDESFVDNPVWVDSSATYCLGMQLNDKLEFEPTLNKKKDKLNQIEKKKSFNESRKSNEQNGTKTLALSDT